MPSRIVKQKQALRDVLRRRLSALSPAEKIEATARIRTALDTIFHGNEKPIRKIASFAGLSDEPDLMPLCFETTPGNEDREWHLPRVDGDELQLFRVRSVEDLMTGAFQIREPDPDRCQRVAMSDIDLILVPGLGFDPETGQRLGRGKGFYDRFLSSARTDTRLIGIGFDCQLTPVPTEAHDVPLQAIVTESGIRNLR